VSGQFARPTATGNSALPAYARRMDASGGAFQLFWLKLLFHLTTKRSLKIDADIAALRAKHKEMDARFGKIDPEVRHTPVDAGGVAAEWLDAPASSTERVLLYFHGGAFMFRLPRTHAHLVAGWSRQLKARVLMVDYRLAPEHPFPAAPDDCHAAYRWLLSQGVAPANVVLGGDSAGGNLVLAVLHRIKSAGEPMPRCAVLLSPFVDFTLSGESLIRNERADPLFTLRGLAALRAHYAPADRFLDPALSPLFGDFTGLPPLLFQAGSSEMLLDESARAAARAHAAGVKVRFEIWDGMPHVFQALSLPPAERANQRIVEFIRQECGWS